MLSTNVIKRTRLSKERVDMVIYYLINIECFFYFFVFFVFTSSLLYCSNIVKCVLPSDGFRPNSTRFVVKPTPLDLPDWRRSVMRADLVKKRSWVIFSFQPKPETGIIGTENDEHVRWQRCISLERLKVVSCFRQSNSV